MRKDYYAAHVSQNLPRLDKDATANGYNVAHMRGLGEAPVGLTPSLVRRILLYDSTEAGHGEAKADTARRKGRGSYRL